ncbi:MAG: Crp/Fnr family transcriptional regulator [Verrucomicrobia bacterium]|jgi:CRP/FNR family transcriptional regulator, dissimilatory nitrate respiration regulator|nr:Crp/Fnr family transcriptional regulator [Verrucomicrobiota bacterium]
MKIQTTSVGERVRILRLAPIFAGLADAGVQALSEVSTVREYEEGEYLFQQDEQAEGFHVVVEGAVNVHRFGPDGRQQILHVFEGGGELCGEVPVFEGSTYPAAAVATARSRTLYLPRLALLEVARQHPEILLKILATLSLRLRRFVGLIDDLSLKDVSARLAKYLLDLSEKAASETIVLDTTKVVLAARLGTIAETISRTFRKLQGSEVIDVRGREITILDEDRLQDIAAGMKS